MNSKFKDYLPPNIIQEGIDLCLQNVKDLLLECKLLLRKKKYSRAMALSITTLEEIGKINVLRSINRIPKKRQKLRAKKWDSFYDHRYKSTFGFVDSYPDFLRKVLESLTLVAISQFLSSPICEEARQLALYTDYSKEDKCWLSPKLITKEIAFSYYKTAAAAFLKVNNLANLGLFSIRVLEIEKEVYQDIFENIPDNLTDPEILSDVSKIAPNKAKEFFERLLAEGIIKESDIQYLLKG